MKCPKCGAEILQGHYYCSSCDYRLTPEEYHQANARRGPGKGLICAIAAVAVLAVGAAAFFIARPHVGGPKPVATEAPTEAPTEIGAIETPEPMETAPVVAEPADDFTPFPVRFGQPMSAPTQIRSVDDLCVALGDMLERGEISRTFSALDLTDDALFEAISSYEEITQYTKLPDSISIVWDPGVRIWHAALKNQEDRLSARDRRILGEARSVLQRIIPPGATDLEKERAIHDYICDHCAYLIDPGQETESCYGFFDHGLAQCAGYADTFQLLCRLEGLWVRSLSGEALDGDASVTQDLGHTWSLIYLDDQWYTVDVTWDDNDSDHDYCYYNIPNDYLSATRTWRASTLPAGRRAQALDEKWGYWALPYASSVSEGAQIAENALRSADEVLIRLAPGVDGVEINGVLANRLSRTMWYTEFFEKSWARIYRFANHG